MAAGIVGAPLSGLLLSMRGIAGLDGWQWLFLVEGLPAVALGIVALFYLTDTPEAAEWLPEDERHWLVDAIRRDRADATRPHARTLRAAIGDPIVWFLASGLFLIVTSGYGFSFFLPQIVKAFSGASDLAVGLWTAVPFLLGAAAMIGVATHSDRTGERRGHVAVCACVAAVGLAVASAGFAPIASFTALSIAATGLYRVHAAVLVAADSVSEGRRRRGWHRIHQCGRKPGWVPGPIDHGLDERRDRRLPVWSAAARSGCHGFGPCGAGRHAGVQTRERGNADVSLGAVVTALPHRAPARSASMIEPLPRRMAR